PLQVTRGRDTDRRGDRGRRVARLENVVLGLVAAEEAREPALLLDRVEPVVAAGQDLVRVALVAHIPDQSVPGGVEGIVQRDREFYHTQVRREMTADLADHIDQPFPYLAGEFRELIGREPAQILRRGNPIEQW